MKIRKGILIPVVIGGIIGFVIAGTTAFAKIYVHGKFPANTFVVGIDVSLKTPEEAAQILEPKVKVFEDKKITISAKGKEVTKTPSELGIKILTDETIKSLTQTDASQINIFDLFPLYIKDKENIGLQIEINEKKLDETLEQEFKISEINPKNAKFFIEGKSLKIEDEKEGEVLLKEELLTNLKNNSQFLKTEKYQLGFKPQAPTLLKTDLQPQIPEIQEKLNRKITIKDPVYSEDWYVTLMSRPDWVVFEEGEEKVIKITVNFEPLNTFINEEISKWLDKKPEDVKIYYAEDQKIKIEGKGRDGMEIERMKLKKSLEETLLTDKTELEVPVKTIPAKYDIDPTIKEMGIKERIAQGHTSYYGSPANRVHNIKVGSSQFEGKIIQPGEEFSFNTNLGRVDGTSGYRKELVIKQEGTIPEYGGGICQVSTTMYRAALMGGLDITDRRPHSYAVSYYSQIMGHGLDATIYLGGQDLKFINDTGYPVLIHTYTDGDYELYIDFYGTSDGRTVELEGPSLFGYHNPGPTVFIESPDLAPGQKKQVEKAHTGFSAMWKYILKDKDGNIIKEEEINSRYKAVPNKILIGPEPVPAQSL